MKNLSEISIGEFKFTSSAQHFGGPVTEVTVKSASDPSQSLSGKLTHLGSHEYTLEELERDINAFAERLARDLAAKIKNTELARKFSKGEKQ